MGGLDADLEPVGEAADRSAPPSTWNKKPVSKRRTWRLYLDASTRVKVGIAIGSLGSAPKPKMFTEGDRGSPDQEGISKETCKNFASSAACPSICPNGRVQPGQRNFTISRIHIEGSTRVYPPSIRP
jgi:hypothetical protein